MSITAVTATGEAPTRAGTHALSLLASPLNVATLQALAKGPTSLIDLRRATGSPPQTTLRKNLQALTELGAVEKTRRKDFPCTVDSELARSGRELLEVAAVVSAWLSVSPEGPVMLGTAAAKSAIKALVDGWSTSILRALAARPLALTELDSLITCVSYPSLERRLGAMRLVGQVEKLPVNGRGTPYAVTDWLRRAVGPLAASARWERRHPPTATPITARDVEGALLLALPLVRLQEEYSGCCRFAVELPGDKFAGAIAEVRGGEIVGCTSRLQGDAASWAVGSATGWLHAVVERDPTTLELGGDCHLASALLDQLSQTLFAVPRSG